MTLIKRLFGDLFGKEEESSDTKELILKEKIEHTQFFLAEYQEWLKAGMHEGIIKYLQEQKAELESNPAAEVNFFQFRSAASNGFYFHGEDPWSNKDYSFLAEFFSSKLLSLGYKLNNSSRELIQQNGQLHCTESFYFKLPLASRSEKPISQLWGNILLEHKLVDERTNYLKLMAHLYNDRSYKEAYDFEDLENEILSLHK